MFFSQCLTQHLVVYIVVFTTLYIAFLVVFTRKLQGGYGVKVIGINPTVYYTETTVVKGNDGAFTKHRNNIASPAARKLHGVVPLSKIISVGAHHGIK